MSGFEMLLLAVILLLAGTLLHVFLGVQQLRGMLRTALRKAESDNCQMVRIPYNQLAEMMGWKVEFESYRYDRTPGRKARGHSHVRTSHYPMREPGGVAQGSGGGPNRAERRAQEQSERRAKRTARRAAKRVHATPSDERERSNEDRS